MFKIGKFGVVIKPFLGLNTNLDCVLEIVYTIEIKYCMGACGRQFRFVFTQEDDILYRWSMIGESADTTQKGFSTLAKNQQLFSYDTETLFG